LLELSRLLALRVWDPSGGCGVDQWTSRAQRTFLLVLVVLALALVLRVVNLDADPSALISRDFITDEGQWSHNVRNALVFGQLRLDDYNPGLYSAYLYHHLLHITLSTLGLSLTAARMVSALAGWLTVVLLFAWVRRETNTRTAVIAALLLGLSNLHVLYSRTAFVESTLIFFMALTLWLWSMRQRHRTFGFLSGVAFGLMLVTKVTAIYIAPGLALFAAAEAIRRTTSKRDALLFLCGASLVGASYALGFVAPNFSEWMNYNLTAGLDNEWPSHPSDLISSMLKLLGSRFYAQTPILSALTLVALGELIVHTSTVGLKCAFRQANNIEITSATLLIGYWFSVGLAGAQPERRFIPALFLMVPLSANLLDSGWRRLEELAGEHTRVHTGGWFAVLFSLPTVAIIELKCSTLGSPLSPRLWLLKAIAVVALALISMALGRGRWPSPLKRQLLAGSKLIFVLLFCVLSLVLVYRVLILWGLSATELRSGRFVTSSLLILTSAIAIAAALKLKPQIATLVIAAFLCIEGLQVSTWLLQPTYSIKQASEALSSLIGEGQTVVTHYETLLVSSGAKVVCYRPGAGFNVDAFERFNPNYILVCRRDNWKDRAWGDMPSTEWPPPAPVAPNPVARFDLCPTRVRGSRFSLELYRLKRDDLGHSESAGARLSSGAH
jgi:4-amino-4-deoxy-L-arabinose transferase-like glycosyltransferase